MAQLKLDAVYCIGSVTKCSTVYFLVYRPQLHVQAINFQSLNCFIHTGSLRTQYEVCTLLLALMWQMGHSVNFKSFTYF